MSTVPPPVSTAQALGMLRSAMSYLTAADATTMAAETQSQCLVITSPGLMSLQDVAELITHRFPVEAYEEAYQVLRESSGPRGKVILDVSAP